MHFRSGRVVALLAVAASAVAVAVPTAGASTQIEAKLTVGAILVEQPNGQPWAIDLHLKAELNDLVDNAELAQSKEYDFKFPNAKLNASKFPVCTANEAAFKSKNEAACPAATQIGGGKANAFGIGIQFDNVPVFMFNSTGTDSNRKIIIFSRLKKAAIDVPVFFISTVKKTSSGFDVAAPIPDIELAQNEFAVVQNFDVTIGKHIKKGGKKISYIEAPQICKSGVGFPFQMSARFANGVTVTDKKTINCEILGVS